MTESVLYWLQGFGALALGVAILWLVIRINRSTHNFIDKLANSDEKKVSAVDRQRSFASSAPVPKATDHRVEINLKPELTAPSELDTVGRDAEQLPSMTPSTPAIDEHPSHNVHKEIWKRFEAVQNNHAALGACDRNFLRAYEFDSRLLNGGLDDFFTNVSTPQAWAETESALSEVGAHQWATLFGRLLQAEREVLHRCYAEGEATEDIDEFGAGLEIWDEWGSKFWAARTGSEFDTKVTFMESLLDEYAIKHFQSSRG